jgi:hypothetical protein
MLAAFAVAALATPALASAQDAGALGVTMGYPGSIGLFWHVSETVAVRPEFSFSRQSVDSTPNNDGSSTWTVATGASALFYLAKKDNLRPYVAPRLAYAHGSGGEQVSSNGWSVAGLVGAQYDLGPRFAVFGETGLSYGHSTTTVKATGFSTDRTGNTIGTVTGVGVIVRF